MTCLTGVRLLLLRYSLHQLDLILPVAMVGFDPNRILEIRRWRDHCFELNLPEIKCIKIGVVVGAQIWKG